MPLLLLVLEVPSVVTVSSPSGEHAALPSPGNYHFSKFLIKLPANFHHRNFIHNYIFAGAQIAQSNKKAIFPVNSVYIYMAHKTVTRKKMTELNQVHPFVLETNRDVLLWFVNDVACN